MAEDEDLYLEDPESPSPPAPVAPPTPTSADPTVEELKREVDRLKSRHKELAQAERDSIKARYPALDDDLLKQADPWVLNKILTKATPAEGLPTPVTASPPTPIPPDPAMAALSQIAGGNGVGSLEPEAKRYTAGELRIMKDSGQITAAQMSQMIANGQMLE